MANKKKSGFYPDWYREEAPKNSYRSIFKWGDPNEYKAPSRQLYKLMKNVFEMTDDDFKEKQEMGLDTVDIDVPVNLSDDIIKELKAIVGADNVKTDTYTRLRVSYGKTMIDLMRLRKKIVENLPDVVLYPSSKEEIEKIVVFCNDKKIPLYVFGGGSSVTRGTEAICGGISLDLGQNFNKVIDFSETRQTITVESGIFGPALEKILNNAPETLKQFGATRAYTCGHFPQSYEFSTVGGWVVTKGAGQNSTYYGKIEDIVFSQEYATPVGNIKTDEYPRCATGPSMDHIMMGAEGTYGILTHVTLRVFRYVPENRCRFGFMFKDWKSAVETAREVMQMEAGNPSIFRISDPTETQYGLNLYGITDTILDTFLEVMGYKDGERVMMLGFSEGEKNFAKNVRKQIKKVAKKNGGFSITGYASSKWETGRFRDPYLREDMGDYGLMLDTLECAVNWDNLQQVYEGVRAYCESRPNTICLCHMSHLYPQGTNLYFIFEAKMNDIDEYLTYQGGIMDNIQKYGAAMSHHHGIGKMTAPWFEAQVGKNNFEVFKTLKQHFDPNNIMNPGGTMAFDLPEDQKRDFINK
ncbi:MAG: FAD-binding oxidoreductase [Oscillospiraceae bacterium]|jgi:alkyldihydroxyacetonephosphate synthase|nr:FAD-binding oxidoreductase [Oscillospiraceae bacterium]